MCITLWPSSLTRIHVNTSHYNDVIMGTMASQITSLTVVYLIVYSGADQRKHQSQSSASLAFVREFTGTGEFPVQRASNAENVSIWWRRHVNRSLVKSRLFLASFSVDTNAFSGKFEWDSSTNSFERTRFGEISVHTSPRFGRYTW